MPLIIDRPPRDADKDGWIEEGTPRERPAPSDPPPAGSRDFGDAVALRTAVYDRALAAARALPPVVHAQHALSLADVAYEGPADYTLAEQKRAVLDGASLGRRLRGTYVLADAAGRELSRRRTTLATIPYVTPRGTFIHNGSEYSLSSQLRLRPGVYTRRQENGAIEAHVNVAPGTGVPHRLAMDPATGRFRLVLGQARLALRPLLRALGATDAELREAWGVELAHANALADDPSVVDKLHRRLIRTAAETPPGGRTEAVAEAFRRMRLDPDVNRWTLGAPHAAVTKELLLDATRKLIAVGRGEAEPDDRDHLAFMTLHGPEDLIAERIARGGPVLRALLWKASRAGSVDRVGPGALTRAVDAAILASGLGETGEQINSLMIYGQQGRVSRLGVGGIPSTDSIPIESRNVQISHLGFIDPIYTPESMKVGVDSRVARNARKGADGKIYAPFRDARTGRTAWLTPADLAGRVVAFPGELATGNALAAAVVDGKIRPVPRDRVDYELPAMEDAFGPLTNLVPLKSAIKPQRAVMASRMLSQALPLETPEAPLVRGGVPGEARSFEELHGAQAGAVRGTAGGTVVAADADRVVVRGRDGRKTEYQLYNQFPLNRKTAIHQTAVVRPGDVVAPGQLLARSNYTDEQGTVALGRNARVAYVPNGSIAAWTHVLWYEDGQPRFTVVEDVIPKAGMATMATDPTTLETTILPATGFSAHSAGDLLRIRTSSGRVVDATATHSFVTLGDDGRLVEIAGKDLLPGVSWLPRLGRVELPVTATTVTVVAGRKPDPLIINLGEDFGFVCGLYAAEGSAAASRACFAVSDPVLREEFISRLIRSVPAATAKVTSPWAVMVGDSRLARWLRLSCGNRAQHKRVPDIAFGAPEEFRRGFIAGFWVGDGRVHDKGGVPNDTDTIITSRSLRDGLGLLLASLGISTTHGNYDDKKCSEGKTYRLGVSTRDTHKMPDLPHSVKGARLLALKASYRNCGSADHVPIFESVRDAYSRCGLGHSGRKINARIKAQARSGSASRRDILAFVPEDTDDPALRCLRHLASASLEWDRVSSINTLPHDGWVYDFDMAPLRTFVCVDTLIVHNSNFEDAIVISKSFADKLASAHAYQHFVEQAAGVTIGKHAHLALFPGTYDRKVLANFDDDGVVRPGTVVRPGDPLVLAARRRDRSYGSIHAGRKPTYADATETWEHHAPGVVTDVSKTRKGVLVAVKSTAATEVGDKLSGRMADKGVISEIVDDDQMPRDVSGQPYEVLMNPLGIISRVNPAQLVEAALGKVAAATGRTYTIHDFDRIADLTKFAQDELARHGLVDRETIVDPKTGRKIPGVFTGNRFIMKLHHTSESKGQGRGLGAYTAEGMPAKGGTEGSKRISLADVNALLSHGATEVIRDAGALRGQSQPEFWQQYMSGHAPPVPRVPVVHEKFLAQLRAAGLNPLRDGTATHLLALTDRDVATLAGPRALRNAETVDWRDNARPVPGGLFDPGLTGGTQGNQWAHIPLAEPLPSPAFEEPIRRLLGLTGASFRDVLAGRAPLGDHGTGPKAIKDALAAIKVDRAIERARTEVASGRKGVRDLAVRKLGYLKAAARFNLHPADWVLSRVPVLPPRFRPVSIMRGTGLPLVADPNLLYRELWDANENLKAMTGRAADLGDERLAAYDALKAVVGLGEPLAQENRDRQVQGVLKHIFGSSSKFGMVQRKLLGSTVDLVGRAVITPDPDLDMDHVGIPEDKAWDVFRPILVRALVRKGVPRLRAAREVADRGPLARRLLVEEMGRRPVIISRAPVLHRYSFMAFYPRIVPGNTVRMPTLVYKGYGADNDGNCVVYDTEISLEIDPLQVYNHDPVAFRDWESLFMRLTGETLVLVADNTKVFTCKIGEFPRFGKPTKDRNGADIYRVPKGISVLSYDHTGAAVGYRPVTSLTVEAHHSCVRVVTDRGREVEVSDNESLCVFDTKVGGLVRVRPAAAIGRLAPAIVDEGVPGTRHDRDLGWWYGALISDGWLTERTVGYAKVEEAKRVEFVRIATEQISTNFVVRTYTGEQGDDKYGHSVKVHLNGVELRREVFDCYVADGPSGRSALRKSIPSPILDGGSRACLLGLLSGLFDGDGTFCWNYAKQKRQFVCRYPTSSPALARDVQRLCRRLGIRTGMSITPATAQRNSSYVVMPSIVDLHRIAGELTCIGEREATLIAEFAAAAPPTKDDTDIVPITSALAASLSRDVLAENMTLYSALRRAVKFAYLGRSTAVRILALLDDADDRPGLAEFRRVVANRAVHWDRIRSAEPIGDREVFDIGVPDTKVFAIDNGLIVYDTITYHVPLSDEAVQDAVDKMLPSRNLLSVAEFKAHQLPSQEYISGLFNASRARNDARATRTFAAAADAVRAYHRGELDADDPVDVLGPG